MSTKRVKNNRLVGILGGVVMLGTIVLVIFSPQVPASTRFIFLALSLLVGGLISWSLLDRHFRKTLGQTMRESPPNAGNMSLGEEVDAEGEKPRKSPAQSFAYKVFDLHTTPGSSSAAQALLERGYGHYRRYVTNLIAGALFLWISFPILSLASDLLLQQSSFSFNLLCGLTLVLGSAFFVANPQRSPTSFTVLIWFGLNLVFLLPLVAIAVANIMPLFTGNVEWRSLVVFLTAGLILIVYVLLAVGAGSMLKRQVAVDKPMRLLVLWVFNSANNLISTLSGIGLIWQFLGTIQFLRGGGLTVDMGELATNKKAELVVDTAEELRSRLKAFGYSPNGWGLYPRNTLLCGDRVWKAAVRAFLGDADVVAMSLFGFSKSNQGCLYELGLLFDAFPIKRLLFLVDDTTDLDFLLATLQENWDNMAADSPNQGQGTAPVRIYRLSKRFDQPLSIAGNLPVKERGQSGEHPMLWTARAFSATQSAIAGEAHAMLKLLLEGMGG